MNLTLNICHIYLEFTKTIWKINLILSILNSKYIFIKVSQQGTKRTPHQGQLFWKMKKSLLPKKISYIITHGIFNSGWFFADFDTFTFLKLELRIGEIFCKSDFFPKIPNFCRIGLPLAKTWLQGQKNFKNHYGPIDLQNPP